MSFGALLETALAGSLRRAVPAALPALDGLGPEDRLLRSASYEGMRRLAGRPLDPVEGVIEIDACGPEVLAAIAPSAAARLLDILSHRPELLLEWLTLVAERKLRVAHDCLPDLLEAARTRPVTHALVIQVGGRRLAWLANLNPDWHFAAQIDPLDQLAPDPSAADELLLLQAVRDSRKPVREKGLRLIRRIPDSHFGRRWIERALTLVRLSVDGSIAVHEPDEPDPAWIEDGLDPRPPKGMGRTAWILQQTLALTPPWIWPRGMLAAVGQSDWSQPLLSGLAQAAVAYADADWCEALVLVDTTVHSASLLAALGNDRAEAVVRQVLETQPDRATPLMASLTHAWSEEFSRLVVGRVPGLAGQHDAAVRLDPRVLPEVEGLLESGTAPAWARHQLQRLASTLAFRLAMRAELETS